MNDPCKNCGGQRCYPDECLAYQKYQVFLLKKDIDILSDRLIDVYVEEVEKKEKLIEKLYNIWRQEQMSLPELLETFSGYCAEFKEQDVINFSSEEYINEMEKYYESKNY